MRVVVLDKLNSKMPIDLSKLSDSELEAIAGGGKPESIQETSTRVLEDIVRRAEQEDIAARRVQTPSSAFSMVRPEFMGAQFQPEEETIRKGQTAAIRYAPPIAAGMLTGGVGLVPAAVIGLTAAGAEALAEFTEVQAGERKEISGRDVLASGVGGAAPIFQFKTGAADALVSPAVKSFLTTAAGQMGSGEASRYITQGEFKGLEGKGWLEKAKEGAIRWGLPIGVGYLSAKGGQLEKAAEDIAQIESEGRRAIVMDVRPELATLEAKAFQGGHSSAIALANDMELGMADVVSRAYGDLSPQSQAEIAQLLAPFKTQFDDANAALQKASAVAEQANNDLKIAEATRSKDLAKIKAAAEMANEQRLFAEEAKRSITRRIFGKESTVTTSDIALGQLQTRVMDRAKAADEGVQAGLNALYESTGLRPNDAVVSKEDVLRSIQARSAKGRAMEGNVARSDAEKAVDLFFGENQTATLEEVRNFKRVIADRLPDGGPADAAARYAGSLYDALKQSSLRFIEKTYSPEVAASYRNAQNRAAANFESRQGSAIELLKTGKFKEFYEAVKDQGRNGPMMAELDAYANSLSRLTNRAIETGEIYKASDIAAINMAKEFKRDVNSLILNQIINESVSDARKAGKNFVTNIIDSKKFIETLGHFESMGFPMSQLGIKGDDFSKLMKANAMLGKEPITVDKLNDFLEMLPSTGADTAAARIAFRQAVANSMIEAGAKEKTAAYNKAKDIARKAKLDEDAMRIEYNKAVNDPTTKFFAEKGSMLIGNGALQNSDWVNTIIAKDPDTIKGFVAAIQDPASEASKLGVMSKLREATIAYAVKQFLPDVSQTGQKLDSAKIVAPFISNNREMVNLRENMKTILGKDSYDRMIGTVIEPLRKALVNRVALGQDLYNITDDIKGILSAQALASGRSTAGVIAANAARNTANMLEKAQYTVLGSIWLNPEFFGQLVKAGYDLNKFAQLNERNRIALEFAMKQDDKQQQDDLRRQYIR